MPIAELPCLTFKMRLPVTKETAQIYGMLYLQFKDQLQQSFRATSGIAGKQYIATQFIKGVGSIPSSRIIAPQFYSVSTTSHSMSVAGHIGAAMFAIFPSQVKIGTTGRGDFGIHEDLNVPGTIGCIGLPGEFQWVLFSNAMKKLREQRISVVPLKVIYI